MICSETMTCFDTHPRVWFNRLNNDDAARFDYDTDDFSEFVASLSSNPHLVFRRDSDGTGLLDWAVDEWVSADIRAEDFDDVLTAIVLESIVLLLLAHGADPNVGPSPPLFRVCSVHQAGVLIDFGANINARNASGSTPIMHAIHDAQLYDYLLSRGADPHQANVNGETASSWLEKAKTNQG
jgi:hypothetical protein